MKKYFNDTLYPLQSLADIRRYLELDIIKVEWWVSKGENVYSNRDWLNDVGYPLHNELDKIHNIGQLFELWKQLN